MSDDQRAIHGLDPSDVVVRQDTAFRRGNIDTDLWLTTLFLPLVILTNGKTVLLPDRETAVAELEVLGKTARDMGIAALRTRILSHVQPAPDLSILCSIRDRLDADGEVMASTSMTWTLMLLGEDWKITQIIFEENALDHSVTGLVRRTVDPK
ncbi:MAG: hypothetical protein AAF557_10800 [Pseudomonadota bacterium]